MNKKMKALLLLISIIAVALIGIFIWERVHVSFHNEEKVASSISIIGGADGPTSVFLSDKNQTIYVYCRSGNRSKQAAAKLVNLGYKNIIECGGIIDWKGDIEK